MDSLIFNNSFSKEILLNYNPLVFAFIGDALHTLYVRNFVIKLGNTMVKKQHQQASMFCQAQTQARVLDSLELLGEEPAIVRRARNTKTSHSAKNATDEEYKKATAFEALLGWHYLQGNNERVKFLLEESVKVSG